MSGNGLHDSDDMFAETRMTFGDHIEELRHHLFRALIGFGVALVFSFFIGHYVVKLITVPVRNELSRYYQRHTAKILKKLEEDPLYRHLNTTPTRFTTVLIPRDQARALVDDQVKPDPRTPRIVTPEQKKKRELRTTLLGRVWDWFDSSEEPEAEEEDNEENKFRDIPLEDVDKETVRIHMSFERPMEIVGSFQASQRIYLDSANPTTLNVHEAFLVWFKVCIVCGIVIGSPWIFYQIWAFVAAGLYSHEKRLVHVYLPVSVLLFLGGVVLCEVYVIPKAIQYLLIFNEWMNLKPDLRLNEWLSFAIFLPLVFGISFQTPLVMLFVGRLGIVDADGFRAYRKYVWFGMAVFAGFITPPDPITLMFLWVPMGMLYELGIFLIQLMPGRPLLDLGAPEPDEMVEV